MTVNVLAVDFWWGDGCANDPDVRMLIDQRPPRGPYQKVPHPDGRPGWHVYYTETDGFAWFFTWGGKPDDGFGGSRRTITLVDGTEEEIVGGWHVGADTARDAGFPELVEIATVQESEVRGDRTWMKTSGIGGFMTVERARREIAEHRPDVEWVRGYFEWSWTWKWRGQPSKAEHIAKRTGIPYSALGPVEVPDAA
jgi:hypothetical protein